MNRRQMIKTFGLGFASLLCHNASKKLEAKSEKLNVIIFYTDDQGTLDLNCFGSEDLHTPHADKLAKEGIRFTQAYAHTVCCPSRASLLTGRHTQRTGVDAWTPCHPDKNHPFGQGPNMNLDEATIAEVLKNEGYATALFGKWHLGVTPGFGPNEQGFDQFFGHLGGFIDNYFHKFLHAKKAKKGAAEGKPFHDLYRDQKEIFMDGQYFPDLVVKEANQFLEKNKEKPFFMYTAFNIPHYPEQADKKFTEMYKDMEMPRRSYAAMVSTVDERIGRILKKLESLGLKKKTLIIYMSDNGHSTEDKKDPSQKYYSAHGGGGNTGKWRGAKGSFLEGGIRVPAIISLPGRIPEGEKRGQAIINADFFPTILEMLNIPFSDRKIDGKSLTNIIQSAQAPSGHKILYWQWNKTWAVREGDWKLIVNGRDTTGNFSSHKPGKRKMETPFLANLSDKEPEWNNHADEQPKIVKRLTRLHDEWFKEVYNI